MTKTHFLILSYLERANKKMTQREIAKETGLSIGTVNGALKKFAESGFIIDGVISDKGRAALEPFRVKRAVFIAAGFGARLLPITLNTPKPLVRVNGVPIIETLLDALLEAEIHEIYIVRGYLREQFDLLKKKYPDIKFIENRFYNDRNNIYSAFLARELFQNAYVLEADLILKNPTLITKYQYSSNYLGVPVKVTDDWCIKTGADGFIDKMTLGGTDCYHMFGISYWNAVDGRKLAEDIEKIYCMPGGKERYWDQVPLEYCIKNYMVEVRKCTFEDILEVDSLADLKKTDKLYDV